MKKLTLAFLTLILYASVVLVTPVRSEESMSGRFTFIGAQWGTNQEIEVSPGEVATLTVVLRYESPASLRNLEANLSLPGGFEAVGGGVKASAYLSGPVSQGSQIPLAFPVLIGLNVEVGNYTADLELRYYFSNLLIPQDRLVVLFQVTGKPHIEISIRNGSVTEGKQQVLIALSNDGEAVAKNLKISRVYSTSATTELVGAEFLGDLGPKLNATVPLSLFVPVGMKGKILPLTVDISYVGPSNVAYVSSQTLQLPVKASDLMQPLTLSLNPGELSIGKSSKVYVQVANSGTHDLSEIMLTLSPDAILRIFGPTNLYIKRLSPGESKRVETEVYVPSTTTAPTATLSVAMTCYDEALWMSRNDDYRFSVLLRGFIDMSLTDAAVIPSTPRAGSPFSITITVTNIGTSTAYAAYAIPSLENLPFKTFGSKSTYIGNIELNLPTTFTVNLQVDNTTETRATLPITLVYMDNLRSLYNVTFRVPIDIAPQTGLSSQPSQRERFLEYLPGGGLLLGVGVVVVVAVVLIILKKRGRIG